MTPWHKSPVPNHSGNAWPGIRVVEWEAGIAGALAGMILVEGGATVTVVEPTGGSRLRDSRWWSVLARGKSIHIVDQNDPTSLQRIESLIRSSDVVIHGHSCGAAPLSILDGQSHDSRLISCAITGFGDAAGFGETPARDLLVSAVSGRCSEQVGWQDGPCYLTHLVPSIVAGLIAVQGIMAALMIRPRARGAQRVDASLLAAALAISELVELDGSSSARAVDRSPQGSAPLYSLYRCGDGKWLQLGCLHAGFVNRAIDVLGIGQLTTPLRDLVGWRDGVVPTTDEVRVPFREAVTEVLLSRPRDFWISKLSQADVPVAPVLHSEEFREHPQAKAIMLSHNADLGAGQAPYPGPFVRVRGAQQAANEPVPNAATNARAKLEPFEPRSGSRASRGRPVLKSRGAGGALEGVTVVEMTNLIAGPMAGRCLADLGAKVIKLESLQGDVFRQEGAPEFHPLNAGKSSLAMNVKTEEGLEVARQLLAGADVFINNMRPRAVDRLGLGFEKLIAINCRLVFCQVSAFGLAGPLADLPGGDPLAGALTGMQAAQGGYDRAPVYTYGAPIDYVSGFLAASGILLALFRRELTGVGSFVDSSLLDAGQLLNAVAMTESEEQAERDDLPRTQYRLNALNGLYPTATRWISLAVTETSEWDRLRALLDGRVGDGLPETMTSISDDDLATRLAGAFREETAEFWLAELAKARVPSGEVREKSSIRLSEPWIADSGLSAAHVCSSGSRVEFIHNWLTMSNGHSASRGPAPGLGEQTAEILHELGMDDAKIQSLYEQAVVSGGRGLSR
jgi:crotonobetainyl-CoA:carnitine CoA-transferase CaiB-like acyl-CoA transferase